MENFVLYDEIGKSDNTIIYKGRRKGTVIFLAIYCVEKFRRAEITNQVRLTHEIKHSNIQQFYEWYETSNHLWLVLELCNGGTLQTLIELDGALPESCVRQFGRDIVEGLHGIHSLGLIFSDLRPSKLLVDGSGTIKFSDFSLARVEGENLDELLTMFGAQTGEEEQDLTNPGTEQKSFTKTSSDYMAPEVIQGGTHTMQSDLWSLGIVLYQLFTGHCPFEDDNFAELVNKILHQELPPPNVKGSRLSAKPSPDLVTLLQGLLKKNPAERMHWQQVLDHPFWQDSLAHLATDSGEESSISVSQSVSQPEVRPVTPLTKRASSNLLEHTVSSLGYVKDVELRQSLDRPISALAGGDAQLETIRPKSRQSSATGGDMEPALFTMSNRPSTSHGTHSQEQRTQTRGKTPEDKQITDIIYYTTDWTITNISDNPKIQKLSALRFDQKSLNLAPYSASKLSSMPVGDRDKHLSSVVDLLKASEKGPPTQKRVHLLTYATTLCQSFAEQLCCPELLSALIKQLKEANHIDLRSKIARFISTMAGSLENVPRNLNVADSISTITDMLRENMRNSKLKSVLLPTLGELLFLVGRLEEQSESRKSKVNIPSLTITMVMKCLKEGEDAMVNHYAAKTIENIVSTDSQIGTRFINSDVAQALWYLVTHSMVDAPRTTALSALVRITKKSVGVFESIIEKVGFPNLLNLIKSQGSNRIHQAYLTMLCEAVFRGQYKQKYLQHKELTAVALHLLESTSSVVRAKVFVLIYIIVRGDNDKLLSLTQTKLFVSMERDKKKQYQVDKPEAQNMIQYLQICLDTLLSEVTKRLPLVLGELVELLNTISGRKHLSASQGKALRRAYTVITAINHALSSSVFRSYLIDDEFMMYLARLLEHCVSIDQGDTGVGAGGSNGLQKDEFVHSVLSLFEIIQQHTSIIAQYEHLFSKSISISAAQLSLSDHGETKLMSLRLLCELSTIYCSTESLTSSQSQGVGSLLDVIHSELFPQYELILMDLSPIPVYGLKLLHNVIQLNPSVIREMFTCGLIMVLFQVIDENSNNPLSHILQNSLSVLDVIVHNRNTDLNDLYSKGLIDRLVDVCQRLVAYIRDRNDQADIHTAYSSLATTLNSIQQLLKNLSEVVRRALQSQKSGKDVETSNTAEEALHENKLLCDIISILPSMIVVDDQQISELALKSLSLLVQLFGGGENPDVLDSTNIEYYNEALIQGDSKRQKFILRILKRLVTTDKENIENLRNDNSQILFTLNKLSKQASANADAGLSAMAQEIHKAVRG